MADNPIVYMTDKGIPIRRSDYLSGRPIGQMHSMSLVSVPLFDGLPLVGEGNKLYLIEIDPVKRGFIYRWDVVLKQYIKVCDDSIESLIEEAPIDGVSYVRKDGAWAPIASAGGDKHFTYPFVNNLSNEIIVTHGLGKFPAITIIDTAGTMIYAMITHISTDSFKITTSVPIPSGYVYCN